jgi:hypothetical protein
MDTAGAGNSRLRLRDALAGLQAGMLGALLMIAWLMLCSLSTGYTIWMIPNLFATALYGPGVYQNQFLRASWPGLALILVVYGSAGVVWGLLCGVFLKTERRPPFFALTGAIVGVILFYGFNLIWKFLDPLIPLYAPERPFEIGHALWGLLLSRAPLYSRRIAEAIAEPAWPADHEPEEVKSGEVML